MDTSNTEAIEAVPSPTTASPIKRQRRGLELKRQIVEEMLVPGASVGRVAPAHGVNANQVFAWRRRFQQGLLTLFLTPDLREDMLAYPRGIVRK
jgi:transposase-like protein